jgi:serine/tyrosine/threonine adenylyltransferase
MRAKLGLNAADDTKDALIADLLALLHEQAVDYTSSFRALSAWLRGDADPARGLFREPAAFEAWAARWREQLDHEPAGADAVAAEMDRVNPVYIPRNHLVEEALAAATAGDLAPFERLLDVLARPFDERSGLDRYAAPAPPSCGVYQTFCGT